MGRTMNVRTKRSLYVVVSVLLIAGAAVFTRGRADATSSVTPTVAAARMTVSMAPLR